MADGLCLSFDRHKVESYFMPSRNSCIKFMILLIFLFNLALVHSSKYCKLCEQGNCINDSCVCLPGWRNKDDSGRYCNECYGRISLNESEGVIYDGSGNYSKNHACSWLLDTGQNGRRVTFQINQLATECIWDHLYIHDGDSSFAPMVAAYSGVRVGKQTKPNLKIILSGRYSYIHFYSDAAYTLPGFNVSYRVDDCDLDCSDNAVCNEGRCECSPGWRGTNCDSPINGCPNNCTDPQGVCDSGVCKCLEGFRGDDCSYSDKYLLMERMPVSPPFMTGRASFAFTKNDNSHSLWIVGGYRNGDKSEAGNLFRFDVASKQWFDPQENNKGPWPRYGHTTVFYQGDLYLYGGTRISQVMDDLWKFSISSGKWTKLSSGPRNLSGHSAEIVGTRMLIFFGYSIDYGYSNKVMECDLANNTWQILETQGSVVQGGYGHSSVYDQLRQKIYVYGGYHSPGSTPYNLTDMLYEFEPINAVWTILHSSGKGHYLHSAAMMNGLMLVFGGNTNNDSRLGRQAECYTSDFLVYDRDCNRWHSSSLHPGDHVYDLDRFGQKMISVGNDVYMFGGFRAWSKSDLWKITAGLCSALNDTKSCENSVPGIKCTWNNATGCVASLLTEKCEENQDVNFNCSGFNRCKGCLSQNGCKWCSGTCFSVNSTGQKNCSLKTSTCASSVDKNCALYQSCASCQENSECVWSTGKCKAFVVDKKTNKTSQKSNCENKKCSTMDSCLSCTKADCMWCSNLKQCILTNSYVAFYFYGQCMDWTTKEALCPASNCSTLKTCDTCRSHPQCGWCDDDSGTGTGFCHDGGMGGPVTDTVNTTTPQPLVDYDICPRDRWFFTECPTCQCNGHSQCVNDTSTCADCQSHTTGSQCQICEDGYYGAPLNGANCSACDCNDQADSCHPTTGDCFCKIRGVIGRKCDRCDDDYKYIKNGANSGTCFYHLNTDFSYTFNLSKREDSNYTQINFINTPTSSDRDVDFTLNCSTGCVINVTYVSKSFPMEKEYVSNRACDYFRTKFEHKNHAFGGKENTTFYVYVYDFKTPFKLQISFVQRDKLNLVQFFIIFFSCFLTLLLVAAALWKIKHKYDGYRRRRQLIVEMQQMASRPFSTISVEIDRKSSPPATADKRDHLDSVLRRRKKTGTKPSEVAIEPLADSKAAILTLIVQLPTGGGDFAPAGQSGLAMGSALVSMGSHRKQSLDHVKGEKTKLRKNLNNVHPDACA